MLAAQILHFTDKTLADHGRTLEAVRASETLLQQVNEAVRRHESQLRLTQVQSRLVQSLESDVIFTPLSCDLRYRMMSDWSWWA